MVGMFKFILVPGAPSGRVWLATAMFIAAGVAGLKAGFHAAIAVHPLTRANSPGPK